MSARRNTPLKLQILPGLAEAAPLEASALGLTLSGLVAILVWNDAVKPAALVPVKAHARLSRVALSCSLRRPQRALASAAAHRLDMSLNAYLEALLAARLGRGGRDLTVRRRRD